MSRSPLPGTAGQAEKLGEIERKVDAYVHFSDNFSLFSGEYAGYNTVLDTTLRSYKAGTTTDEQVNWILCGMTTATAEISEQPSLAQVREAFYSKTSAPIASNNQPPDKLSALRNSITSAMEQSSIKIDATIGYRLKDIYELYAAATQTKNAKNRLLIAKYYYALYNHGKKSDAPFLTLLLGFIDKKNSLPKLNDELASLDKIFAKMPKLIKFIDDHYQYLLSHDTKNLIALSKEELNSPSEDKSPLKIKIRAATEAKDELTKIGANPTTQEKLHAIHQHTALMTKYSKDEQYSNLHRDPQWQRWLIMGLFIASIIGIALLAGRMLYSKIECGTVKIWRPHQRNVATQLRRCGEEVQDELSPLAEQVILACA